MIVANYIYDVPNLGQKLNVKPLGWVTDHWTISGITQWHSDIRVGVPAISFSGTTSTNPQMNWTGGYEGARMLVVGNPQLPSGQALTVNGIGAASGTFDMSGQNLSAASLAGAGIGQVTNSGVGTTTLTLAEATSTSYGGLFNSTGGTATVASSSSSSNTVTLASAGPANLVVGSVLLGSTVTAISSGSLP